MTNVENQIGKTELAATNIESEVSSGNYDSVRFNALKHGILSRYTVLSHEDAGEYGALLAALLAEHQPAGATEAHLVEELAGIIWRKRRVLQAEGANINQGLKGAARNPENIVPAAAPFEPGLSGSRTDLRDLMAMTPEDVAESQRDARHDLDATRKAGAELRRGGANAYKNALRALLPDSRDWWERLVESGEYSANADGLTQFIAEHLDPLCSVMDKEARYHEAIKAQTLGEGLQVYRLEKLTRYETHLDRKFERTLAMLVKLKELRSGR